MENNEIGPRIQELMFRLKLKQTSFAESIGVSQTAVNKIVNGQTKPRFALLEAICNKYPQVNKDWLMSGKGEMFTNVPAAPTPDGYLQGYFSRIETEFVEMRRFFQTQLEAKDRQIEFLMGQLGKPECVTETGVLEHPATAAMLLEGLGQRA